MSRHQLHIALLILSPVICPASVYASAPSLSGVTPYGFQRGTEVEASFTGARLTDAQEFMFYSPGIKVVELKAERDNLVKAKLALAPECRIGIHAVRLRTASGVSNLRTFTVGSLPEVAEKEPNNDFDAPQSVPFGSTVSGVVQSEDVDHFIVEAKKGDRIVAELEGIRLGYTFFDPYLAILNSERFELARSDDAALLRQDCLCAVVAPKDGNYIVQVRESAYGGNGSCKYRLHVGRFPRPTAVLPAGGRPGETLTVRWIGDAAVEWTEQVTLPSLETLEHDLFAQDQTGIAPSPNVIRVADLANAIEVEPNDARDQASPASAPGALNGVIEKPGDTDHFKFAAKKGQRFDIRVYARNVLRSPLDSVLVVRRANGAGVGSNDDSGGPDSYYLFTAPADEEYTVEIYDHLRAGGPDYAYRVEIAPVKQSLTITLPERERYVSTTLSVARGNRMALMINAARANWGGELDVSVEGLPEGSSMQTLTMPANRTTIPVLFSAAADAPVGGTLTDVVGRPVDKNLSIVGHLNQRTMLVRGQNNRDVWGHDADRMAAVVTEELPFQLDIVQPKAPVARQGSKELKVVAKRKEGFNQAIAIRLLYNPPGIGSSGSISIPADKNEAVIPLTANGNAAIGTWPIIVTGSTNVGGGRVEAATQMADLTISDSFFGFAFEKTAAELGQETELVVNIENKIPFDGEAEVRLLGLPANTSTKPEPVKITKETTQIVFPIKVEEKARPATYKSLVCRAVIMQNEEPITHTLGAGELRVDKPLPPKVAAPKPEAKPQPKPKPAPAQAPPKKRLSRLELLRLEKMKQQGEQ
ncbi:MAG: PPC domain-containing protein [Pirellulaceae bacterium]|nr:PPC domain-containing protein [Pirellulaceae bacterium]